MMNLPPRVAVLGSGPGGLYTTKLLLSRHPSVHVDIFESLPTPFGLLRYGVAPDHASTKSPINSFTQFLQSHRDRFDFYGNVNIDKSTSLSMELLQTNYDQVVIATGAKQARTLETENVQGVILADKFARWANGDPRIEETTRKEIEHIVESEGKVVVVGMGNVGLDVARLILRRGEGLKGTDVSLRAMKSLENGKVGIVEVIGRKGPSGGKWSTAALRELVQKTKEVKGECDVDAVRETRKGGVERKVDRMLKVLEQGCVREGEGQGRIIRFKFGRQVKRFERIGSGIKTIFQGEGGETEGNGVFVSAGYIAGGAPGLTVGWAGNEARGIIGDNLWAAEKVVGEIIEGLEKGKGKEGVGRIMRDGQERIVDWEGWLQIDKEEIERAKDIGWTTGRVKMESIEEMLNVAGV